MVPLCRYFLFFPDKILLLRKKNCPNCISKYSRLSLSRLLSISNLCMGPLMDTLGNFSFSISNFFYLKIFGPLGVRDREIPLYSLSILNVCLGPFMDPLGYFPVLYHELSLCRSFFLVHLEVEIERIHCTCDIFIHWWLYPFDFLIATIVFARYFTSSFCWCCCYCFLYHNHFPVDPIKSKQKYKYFRNRRHRQTRLEFNDVIVCCYILMA